MRTRRIFYEESYHHIMNHCIDDKQPFNDEGLVKFFINLMEQYANIYKIQIYAYCIMPNHFHIVCKNTAKGLPEFVKVMCSRFVLNYNRIIGRKGPLFYDRYKSTIIQDDDYLMTSILYSYLNPNRKGIVQNPFSYKWSSINQLFKFNNKSFVDNEYVEQIFGSYDELIRKLDYWLKRDMKLPLHYFGELEFLGDHFFYQNMVKLIDKRKRIKKIYRKRKWDNTGAKSIRDVMNNIESKYNCQLETLNYHKRYNKNIRNELLKKLRDDCGLKYSQIILLKPFSDIKYQSLSHMYTRSKGVQLVN